MTDKPAYLPLTELLARMLPDNPKDHDIGALILSFRKFGFIDKPILNLITGHVLSGHGRIQALAGMKAGAEAPPKGVLTDGNSGDWLVPIQWEEIKTELEPAAIIALNRLVELGGWDEQKRLIWLQTIAATDESLLRATGYDGNDIDAMLRASAKIKPPEPERKISPELFERHDYLVMYFDNELDWQVACDLLGVETVLSGPVGKKTVKEKGLGRVIRGADVIAMIQEGRQTDDQSE